VTIAPTQDQSNQSNSSVRRQNIFEDPAIQEAARSDAFTRFVVNNWKTALLALVAVAGAMIAFNVFTTTALKKRADATTRLADIQETYKGLVDTQDALVALKADLAKEGDEEKKKTISGSIETKTKDVDSTKAKLALMLDALNSPEPFDVLAKLYRGLLASRFNDVEGVRGALGSVPAWDAIKDEKSSDRFVAETVALGLNKALAQSEGDRQAAKNALKALAERGSFVAVEAAHSLSVYLTSPEEKAAFVQILDSLKGRFPSQERSIEELRQRAAA
jgi:hypothetical protein